MPDVEPFLESTALIADPPALRARAAEDGYLFFRGLLPPDALLEVRRQMLTVLERHGWLAPDAPLMEGVARPELLFQEGDEAFAPVYDDVQRLEAFHALAHAPSLLGMFAALFGEPVLVHPRNIARLIYPRSAAFTTPAHQDYVHIQGTPETWTAWFPLGDCPRHLGGLEVLERSHRNGLLPVHAAAGAGGLGVDPNGVGGAWRGGDFACGDVVVFHSHNVHRGVPNHSRERFRLSCDFRYQAASQPVVEGSLQPHHGRLSWDEIYRDWRDESLRYYWRRFALNLAEFGHDCRAVG